MAPQPNSTRVGSHRETFRWAEPEQKRNASGKEGKEGEEYYRQKDAKQKSIHI